MRCVSRGSAVRPGSGPDAAAGLLPGHPGDVCQVRTGGRLSRRRRSGRVRGGLCLIPLQRLHRFVCFFFVCFCARRGCGDEWLAAERECWPVYKVASRRPHIGVPRRILQAGRLVPGLLGERHFGLDLVRGGDRRRVGRLCASDCRQARRERGEEIDDLFEPAASPQYLRRHLNRLDRLLFLRLALLLQYQPQLCPGLNFWSVPVL